MKTKEIKNTSAALVAKITIVAVVFFWFTMYLPVQIKIKKIEPELKSFRDEIAQIEKIAGTKSLTGEVRKLLQDKLSELEYKLPQKEEKALKELFDLAKEFGVDIIFIKPKPKEIAYDENRKELKVENRIIQTVFISIKMRCSYAELTGYIGAIKKDLPAFVTIESLYVDKDKFVTKVTLNVTLNLNLYFLS